MIRSPRLGGTQLQNENGQSKGVKNEQMKLPKYSSNETGPVVRPGGKLLFHNLIPIQWNMERDS